MLNSNGQNVRTYRNGTMKCMKTYQTFIDFAQMTELYRKKNDLKHATKNINLLFSTSITETPK